MNGLKGIKNIQGREFLFKYQSCIYNVQKSSDVNHIDMKMRWNNKLFPSLNVIKGKISSYGSKGILRRCHYRSDPKLGSCIFSIKIMWCSCHTYTTLLYLSWDSKIREAVNQPKYDRVYNWKYSQFLCFHNNWIIIIFLDDGTYEED